MVVSALESGSDEFLAHLFQEGQLISWLTSAPEAITPKSRPNDDRAGAVPEFRFMSRFGLPPKSRPSDAWASAVLLLPPSQGHAGEEMRRPPGPMGLLVRLC